MRAVLLLLALALPLISPVGAQDKAPPAPKKKAKPQPQVTAHKKPTPEQIRKFNQLEKKQPSEPAKK